MRAALVALALLGCHKQEAARPPPNEQLRMAWVYGAPNTKNFERFVSVQAYVRAPQRGEHWSVIDARGLLAEVEITEPEPGECDHCPPFRMLARVLERRPEWGANYVAIGPASGPLRNARIIKSNWQWHAQLENNKFVFELELDADGDGVGDLARWVRGPQIEYEIRARIGGAWVVREHWLTADILDVMDRCPGEPSPDDCLK